MPTHQKRKITLEDVAQRAGVSVSTASRALKQHTSISTLTRDRVAAAAEMLNYIQMSDRTDSANTTTKTVAMVVTDIHNPYHNSIVLGLEDEAGYDNANLVLMTTRNDPLREQQVFKRLTTLPLEGMVMLNSCLSEETIFDIQAKRNLPTVIFNYTIEHSHIGCVIPDTRSAAYRAATYLISLGHRRIAYIGTDSRVSMGRLQGVEEALDDAGIKIDPSLVIRRNVGDEERGVRAMKDLLALDCPPSAVIALNDTMAYGAMHVIHKHGWRVPDDISVIGFDDIPSSAYITPPLTTVALPTYRMGQLAMRLIRRIQSGEDMRRTEPTILESPLIIRESTGPVPKKSS